MTFKELQDNVLNRLNLTTAEARTRVKVFLNERYRRLQTSIGLGRVRFVSSTFPTINGTYTYSPVGLIKPLTLTLPAQNIVLDERSMDQIRLLDPDNSTTGVPYFYVVQKFNAKTVTLYLWPKPDAIYTIAYDGIATGADMTADSDIPAVPEDFHDVIEFGAVADELMKMEKPSLSQTMEVKADLRTRELRYFLAKSIYLSVVQGGNDLWWWGPWYQSYRGFY